MINYFPLSTALLFGVSGKDARRYLNARLSNDIKTLSPGALLNAAALTAQGRIQGIYRVLAQDTDNFILVCDGGDKEAVLTALKKFIVADRVEVKELSQEYLLWHMSADDLSGLHDVLGLEKPISVSTWQPCQQGFIYPCRRSVSPGIDLIISAQSWAAIEAKIKSRGGVALEPAQVELRRISAAIPSFPQDLNEDCILLEAGLEGYASFTKGCYVGQEVVEKIDSHGRPPRRLVKLQAKSTKLIESGSLIIDAEGRTIGKVTSSALDPSAHQVIALAFVRNQDKPLERLQIGDVAFEVS